MQVFRSKIAGKLRFELENLRIQELKNEIEDKVAIDVQIESCVCVMENFWLLLVKRSNLKLLSETNRQLISFKEPSSNSFGQA